MRLWVAWLLTRSFEKMGCFGNYNQVVLMKGDSEEGLRQHMAFRALLGPLYFERIEPFCFGNSTPLDCQSALQIRLPTAGYLWSEGT